MNIYFQLVTNFITELDVISEKSEIYYDGFPLSR